MIDKIDYLFGSQPKVDGGENPAGLRRTHEDLDELRAIKEQRRHPISLLQAEAQEGIGQLVASLIKFPVREPPIFVDEGRPIGEFIRLYCQERTHIHKILRSRACFIRRLPRELRERTL
jgi:hypothetical protein